MPLATKAAFDTVTMGDSSVSIVLPGNGKTYTIDSTTKVNSFSVNTNSLSFDISNNSKVLLKSPDRSSFAISGDVDCSVAQVTCDSTESTILVSCVSTTDMPHSLVITPGATCSAETTGGGGRGSTGGGGASSSGGSSASGPVVLPSPPPTPATNPRVPTSAAATPNLSTPVPTPRPAAPLFQFRKNLAPNSRGNDVKQLQLRLQKLGYFPLTTRANGVFGPTTNASLKKLQAKYKIKETGLGSKTRTLLNSLK